MGRQKRRHFRAAAELVDEMLVEPRVIDSEARDCKQAVTVEALDIVAFEGGTIAPDVDAVLLHCRDQHRAGHGATKGRGVEVRDAAGADVEGAGLDGGTTFRHQLRGAIHEAGFFGTAPPAPSRY